ncbi:hypothetical protein, partial [Clostridium sp. HCS.1]|uniref:hypothetical protein n=1 Tax=Clostridium sp. HCS.1 TaxID=3238594 RepID=UPI003A0FC971
SNIQFTALGVDLAGASADLPKEGLISSISDSSFGTIDENNGLFTSTGKLGQAKALLSYNVKVVGETNFEIEVPNEIYFYNSEISIDKNSSISLGLTTLFN